MEEASEEELKALLEEIEMLERVRCDTRPSKRRFKVPLRDPQLRNGGCVSVSWKDSCKGQRRYPRFPLTQREVI